jgi:hypothetical protein
MAARCGWGGFEYFCQEDGEGIRAMSGFWRHGDAALQQRQPDVMR